MFVRVDGREWLAVLPAETLLGLLARSEDMGEETL